MVENVDKPDWIATGTKVLCYTRGRAIGTLKITEIGKVAKQSFILADEREGRFRITREPSRHEGGTWGWTRCVIPLDSDTARRLLREKNLSGQRQQARNACDKYARNQTKENRLTAIAALQAVEEDE